MRPSREIVAELEQDLRRAPNGKIFYLEGRTDPSVFLALLGQDVNPVPPEGWQHDGVWIRGLGAKTGSGGSAVRSRIRVAHEQGHRAISGIIDGDGDDYESLAADFKTPGTGKPHRWPTYCIENWLPLVGWPPQWGDEPHWDEVLGTYVPYAALNRVVAGIQTQLSSLGLERYHRPPQGPLDTVDMIRDRLRRAGSAPSIAHDVLGAFEREVARCQAAIKSSQNHGHALIDGKWLVTHYAASVASGNVDDSRRVWAKHVAGLGGHPDVRSWWDGLTS